jgi:transcriptional regulator with XRE-family HTH domain
MVNKDVSTEQLLQNLLEADDISHYLQNNNESILSLPFNEYIRQLCEKQGEVQEHIIIKAGISRTYGHQLFSGIRRPSRDKVIQLAFGLGLNFEETQRLLAVANINRLYPRIARDAAIIFALLKGFTLKELQSTLEELKLQAFKLRYQ